MKTTTTTTTTTARRTVHWCAMGLLAWSLGLATPAAVAAETSARPVELDDFQRFQQVANPQLSPDGTWVLYSVDVADHLADRTGTQLWLVKWDGSESRQLTWSSGRESHARWHPDGRSVSYLLQTVQGSGSPQVFVHDLDRAQPRQVTSLPGRISAYEWSPDGSRLALVYRPTDAVADAIGPAKPWVIDRYQFKRDRVGYLTGQQWERIHVHDIATGTTAPLTADAGYEEKLPAWSPDGRSIAFVSNHDANWERTRNDDVFVASAVPGATPRQLTRYEGVDGGFLAWSPDSRLVAYGRGSEQRMHFHNQFQLAVVPAAGGEARLLTAALDRSVSAPVFTDDGRALRFLVADDRTQYLAQVSVAGGEVTPVVSGHRSLSGLVQRAGRSVVVATSDTAPGELHAVEGDGLRKLTAHNDTVAAGLQLQPARRVEFDSADGVRVHALLTLPASYREGQRLPAIIWIHGGPTAQDSHAFRFERQLFAAQGYAVLNINYRGSLGRGAAFKESIFADWGNLEVLDVLAGADHLVQTGIADPERLGIGGWSYGGLLTDYVIASDTRFKAAISGAGSANHISLYGHDQYIHLYDSEFGPPWRDLDLWVKFSYPFFRADRITTPTLFLGGDQDFNVPILGSEQMFQALKHLDVPTQLVVYPGEAHRFTRLSFEKDRYQRYLDWFGRYLDADAAPSTRKPSAVADAG